MHRRADEIGTTALAGEIAHIGPEPCADTRRASGCQSSGAQSGDLIELFRRRPCGQASTSRAAARIVGATALVVASVVVGARGGDVGGRVFERHPRDAGSRARRRSAPGTLARVASRVAARPCGGRAGRVDRCRAAGLAGAAHLARGAVVLAARRRASPSACSCSPRLLSQLWRGRCCGWPRRWPCFALPYPVHQPLPPLLRAPAGRPRARRWRGALVRLVRRGHLRPRSCCCSWSTRSSWSVAPG